MRDRFLLLCLICTSSATMADPVPVILDTDIGNDVDDVLALAVLHSLETRQVCQLKAVTITKDHPQCAAFVDAVNTFYGRGDIPIGVCSSGVTPEISRFTPLADIKDGGQPRYPHDLQSGKTAATAVNILRKTLAECPDNSAVVCQVGFSTNLADLLKSESDTISPLSGTELVRRKVKLLSIMAGAFQPINGRTHLEYNVVKDVPSAQLLVKKWPGRIVFSGFEIGLAATYPAASIDRDYEYVDHHPVKEAYYLYEPPPHNRPTWDLTSVLYAAYPDAGYFSTSSPGTVTVLPSGETRFEAENDGLHTYLRMTDAQKLRVTEALVQLSSQPPD